MPVIAVDIGNSAVKLAKIDSVGHIPAEILTIPNHSRFALPQINQIEQLRSTALVDGSESSVLWSIGSVHSIRLQEISNLINTRFQHDLVLEIQPQHVPLRTHVQIPERLGRDRLIATWQATQLTPRRPLVIVDSGTAVTIDFVDTAGDHQGGVIYPGAHSMLKVLSDRTDALPELTDFHPAEIEDVDSRDQSGHLRLYGRNTETAILLGVYRCQRAAIESAVHQAAVQFQATPHVFLTGGGITPILPFLPQDWQRVPSLLLQGIHAIGERHS